MTAQYLQQQKKGGEAVKGLLAALKSAHVVRVTNTTEVIVPETGIGEVMADLRHDEARHIARSVVTAAIQRLGEKAMDEDVCQRAIPARRGKLRRAREAQQQPTSEQPANTGAVTSLDDNRVCLGC